MLRHNHTTPPCISRAWWQHNEPARQQPIEEEQSLHNTFYGYFNFGSKTSPVSRLNLCLCVTPFLSQEGQWSLVETCPHPDSHSLGSLLITPPGISWIPVWLSVHPSPLNHTSSHPQPGGAGLRFTSRWTRGILKWHDHWWKHHACMAPIVSEELRTASDGGCCFSSCLLYKLIWPETFASLGAGRKKKTWCDAGWHIMTSLPSADSGRSWWSLVLYLAAYSYPNITSLVFSDRGGRTAWDVKHRKHNGLRGSHRNNATSDVRGK